MAVSFKINISTRLGENKFSGLKAKWIETIEVVNPPRVVIWGDAPDEPSAGYRNIFKKKTPVLFEDPHTIVFSFTDVNAGTHSFSIFDTEGETKWRSGSLNIITGNEFFEYNLFPLPDEETMLSNSDIKRQIPLRTLKDLKIPNVDERLSILKRDVYIHPGHIEIKGHGDIRKKDGSGIIASTFDYSLLLKITAEKPAEQVRKKLLYVTLLDDKDENFTITFSNVITSIITSTKKREITAFLLNTLQRKINNSLENILDAAEKIFLDYQEDRIKEEASEKFSSRRERREYIDNEMDKLRLMKDLVKVVIPRVKHIVPDDTATPTLRNIIKNKLHILTEVSAPASFRIHAFLMFS